MNTKSRIIPALALGLLPYAFVTLIYYTFRHFVPGASFTESKGALGAALSSYSGTTIAILIAALTFVIGIGGRNMGKVQRYGYMGTTVIMYALCFVELGVIFFIGLLLIATMKTPIALLPTIGIGMSAASLIHISLLLIQLFNFAKKK